VISACPVKLFLKKHSETYLTGVLSSAAGGEKKITYSNTMSNILQKFPVKNANGSIDLIEISAIFYLEAK
jgi:hypothetical protein